MLPAGGSSRQKVCYRAVVRFSAGGGDESTIEARADLGNERVVPEVHAGGKRKNPDGVLRGDGAASQVGDSSPAPSPGGGDEAVSCASLGSKTPVHSLGAGEPGAGLGSDGPPVVGAAEGRAAALAAFRAASAGDLGLDRGSAGRHQPARS